MAAHRSARRRDSRRSERCAMAIAKQSPMYSCCQLTWSGAERSRCNSCRSHPGWVFSRAVY